MQYIKITWTQAKDMLSNIIKNHKKFKSTWFLSAPRTISGKQSYKNHNSYRYFFEVSKDGKQYKCELESTVTCVNSSIIYGEHFVINNRRSGIGDVKRLYKLFK